MSDSSQARHLEAISVALSPAGTATDADIVPLSAARMTRRRRMVASVVAAALIAPAGLAAASEGSIPGDALYSVKQISERVLVLFDSDVIAEHRVEEIEALEAAGRFDAELYDDARAALTELGEDHPLWRRLAAATGHRHDDRSVSDDDDRSEDDAGVSVEGLTLPDGGTVTATLVGNELLKLDLPPGWRLTEIDDDEATLEHDDYRVEIDVLSDGSLAVDVMDRLERSDDDGDSGDSVEDETSATDSEEDDDSADTSTTSTTAGEDHSDDSDSTDSSGDRTDDDGSESP